MNKTRIAEVLFLLVMVSTIALAIDSELGDTDGANDDINNFSSNDTFYYDIGGETITVDSFVRWPGWTEYNPSFGEAVLLKQCIDYKKAFPEEDVYMTFTSFHLSVVAAACIDHNDPNFGLMKSLYDVTSEGGYVRISELLFEAAKYGIHVIVIGQIDASPVDQYGVMTPDIDFVDYFKSRQMEPCYDLEYIEKGAVVSDYMEFREAEWTSYDDDSARSASDMMHLKSASVSAYIDCKGQVHKNSIWLSSINLDGITSSGVNGNDGVQTGVIISDHDDLWRVLYNFTDLMKDYCSQEDIVLFRDMIIRMNTEQIDLILDGKEERIPTDKQIVYLGSNYDEIFRLYFTPVGGYNNVWDDIYNPFCKNLRSFYNSSEELDLVWISPKFKPNFEIGIEYLETIRCAYLRSTSSNNTLYLQLPGVDASFFDVLIEQGKVADISVNKYSTYWHAKDILLSYMDDGKQCVSVLNSLNIHAGSMNYQVNSILEIHESEKTGFDFYYSFKDMVEQ